MSSMLLFPSRSELLDSALRDFIEKTLQDPAVKTISFYLQGVNVYGPNIAVIGKLVKNRKIGITVDRTLDSSGAFDPNSNTILFDSHTPPKAVIVHEAVHAMLHHHKCTQTSFSSNEAIARLATLIWSLNKGGAVRAAMIRTYYSASFIFGTDERINAEALKLIDRHQLHQRTMMLQWSDYKDLRNAILAHPSYRHSFPWE